MKQKAILFFPATAWFIVTIILLTLPGTQFPDTGSFKIPQQDKVIHFIIFFLIVYLFCKPFNQFSTSKLHKQKWFFAIAVLGLLYGIAIEYIQKYCVPNRSFELWDIVADGAGCFVAYIYCKRKFANLL